MILLVVLLVWGHTLDTGAWGHTLDYKEQMVWVSSHVVVVEGRLGLRDWLHW